MKVQNLIDLNQVNSISADKRRASQLLRVMQIAFPAIVSGLIISLLSACGGGSSKEPLIIDEPSKHVGIWKSQGSGLLLELGESSATVFEITKVSCLEIFDGTKKQLENAFVESLSVNSNDRLVAPLLAANETILFDRVDTRPPLCSNNGTAFTSEPETNFEVLWNTFEEHYSYFEQRNIDWQQKYDDFRNEVNENTSELELMEIFAQMLAPFKDAHISIEGPNYNFDGTDPEVFDEYFARANDPRAIDTIQRTYLNNAFKTDTQALVYWGELGESYGYVNFKKFGGFAGTSLIASEHDQKFDEIVEEIITDFSDKSAIIIDVRNNSGGGDGRVLRLASIFTDTELLMYSEVTRHEGSYTQSVEFSSTPRAELYYPGRVIILTSPISISSAEQLAINLMPLPQATIIGESTYGALSQLARTLPNGWTLKLSNQIVTAADGNDYEIVGVPPQLLSESFTEGDLEAGIDSTLDVAIDYLNSH